MRETFREELRYLINRYSIENASNTPDFILGEYMQNCLNAFEVAVQQRETWYGRDARPSHLNAEKVERCPECGKEGTREDFGITSCVWCRHKFGAGKPSAVGDK